MARIAVVYSLLLIGISVAVSCSRPAEPIPPQATTTKKAVSTAPEVAMHYTWQATLDSLHLYLLFYDTSRLMDLHRTATSLSYQVSENKTIALADTIAVPKQENPLQADQDEGIYLSISIPQQLVADGNTIQMKLWQNFAGETSMHTAFKIELQAAMLQKTGLLVNTSGKPIIQKYITTENSLVLKSEDSTATMVVYYFKSEFSPAPPPMANVQTPQNRTLTPQDSLTITAQDTFKLDRDGLYLLWADKPFASGLLVEPWHFPKITMANEMLQPLIYLTTSTERERLFKAKDPKSAVDNFWLNVAGEKHLARELIRTYYGRVEHANKLYTSHKLGWATDRGMIYMIYGLPSDVSRVANTETWIYRESEMHPYIKFVFTKKQNNFTENHYELIRRREYEESWYSAVAKWRAGITDM